MKLDPSKFGKTYRDFMVARQDNTEWNYVKKTVYDVLKVTGRDLGPLRRLTQEFMDKEDHSGYLDAAKEDSEISFPKFIQIERIKDVEGKDLLKAPCSTEPVLKFYEYLKRQQPQACALVFPLKGMGNWVVHNVHVRDRPGSHRIMISTTGAITSAVYIEDFKTFIEEAQIYI